MRKKKQTWTEKIETKTLDTKPPDQLKKEVFNNDPLPPIQGQQMPVSRIFFISKPDQPERMAGDMKSKAFVLPEVISATNDIFTLCKVQIHGQPEVVETENAECAIFLK